jgi:hypothetical protein
MELRGLSWQNSSYGGNSQGSRTLIMNLNYFRACATIHAKNTTIQRLLPDLTRYRRRIDELEPTISNLGARLHRSLEIREPANHIASSCPNFLGELIENRHTP